MSKEVYWPSQATFVPFSFLISVTIIIIKIEEKNKNKKKTLQLNKSKLATNKVGLTAYECLSFTS